MRLGRWTAIFLGLWLGWAAQSEAQVGGATREELRAAWPEDGNLTRSDALRLAAARNYPILARELTLARSKEDAKAARRGYVPRLFAATSWEDGPPVVGDERQRELGLSGGLAWTTPVGTLLSLELETIDRLTGALGTPSQGALRLSATQPLMRGGWLAGAWTPVEQADVDVEVSREQLRQSLNALLVEVESAYWELAYAQADLEIKKRSRDRAQRQYDDTKENIRRGLLAEPEIHVVEENLVFFEGQLIRAGESLRLSQSRLSRLLQLPTDTLLVASDTLEQELPALPSQQEAEAQAEGQNPSWRVGRLQLERAELQVRLEDQQALPDLGLSASVGLLGQGEDRAESLGEVASAGRPDLRVGLSFELPLSWDVQYARARGAQTDRQRRSLELDGAAVDVRFRLQDLRTTLDAQMRRLGLSQKSVELARLKLDAEEDRYKSGISSLEAVSRFQRDLDNALINERRARVDLLVNWSRLLEAEGVLHRELGIEVE